MATAWARGTLAAALLGLASGSYAQDPPEGLERRYQRLVDEIFGGAQPRDMRDALARLSAHHGVIVRPGGTMRNEEGLAVRTYEVFRRVGEATYRLTGAMRAPVDGEPKEDLVRLHQGLGSGFVHRGGDNAGAGVFVRGVDVIDGMPAGYGFQNGRLMTPEGPFSRLGRLTLRRGDAGVLAEFQPVDPRNQPAGPLETYVLGPGGLARLQDL